MLISLCNHLDHSDSGDGKLRAVSGWKGVEGWASAQATTAALGNYADPLRGGGTVDTDRPPVAENPSWPEETLLGKLDPKSRAVLLGLGSKKSYEAGETLLAQGVPASHVVLLLRGIAKVTAGQENGTETLLAVRFGGDLVGEMGVLEERERSATVTACCHTVARRIEAAELERFLNLHPKVSIQITRMISERLRWANERRLDFAAHNAKTRVVRVLAQIAETYGHHYRSAEPREVPLRQEDLAALASTSLRITQDTLRELEDMNAVQRGYRKVLITNTSRLHKVAKKLSQNPQ
ncbi:Crp/Fnr family transcriptional regulator [Saccharopolyspora sp. NPDC050389]|uniref:Crp/Fnr family transcriptional regulator n=1 Tax=Saccharopolyspora sp. NPDC050389 TaxID=3155516 RepID=UPI0033DD60DB